MYRLLSNILKYLRIGDFCATGENFVVFVVENMFAKGNFVHVALKYANFRLRHHLIAFKVPKEYTCMIRKYLRSVTFTAGGASPLPPVALGT